MHYFQQRYLRENRQFPGMTGLTTVDLPNKGLLSGIEIRVWGVPTTEANYPDSWLHDKIKKIEVIVNGSQVVKSYDARQLLAMMLYKRTPHYSHNMTNVNGVACEEFWYINLGRHYHDLEYMLDLGQVNDPELRIEHDFDQTDPGFGWDKGKGLSDEPYYSVICHILRDPAAVPKGYIKTSEIYRFTNEHNVMTNMTIPRGPTYSNLYLQSWQYGEGLAMILQHYEVNINSDDIIPIRTRIQPLLAANARMYGLFEMTQQFYGLGGQIYPHPLEVGTLEGTLGIGVGDVQVGQMNLWGNITPVPVKAVVAGGVGAVTVFAQLTTRGMLPFSMAAIPLFDPWDENTWVDTSVLGDFWVRVEENAAGITELGTMKLLGDEVVTRYVTPSWP